MKKKHKIDVNHRVIWSSAVFLPHWDEFIKEEYPFVTDRTRQYELCAEMNAQYLDDEKMNLNRVLDGRVVAIADEGRGRNVLLGDNLNSLLSLEAEEYFCDRYTTRAIGSGYELGTKYEFRLIPSSIDPDAFMARLDYGDMSRRTLLRYTKSIRQPIADVYGW